MIFEYIRPIDPSPAMLELESVRKSDAPNLADLIAGASTLEDDTAPLACPELSARSLELPHFSGMSLADVVVLATTPAPAPAPTTDQARTQTPALAAAMPLEPRVLLGPGAMTMTLAVVATLVFGMAVAAQVY